MSTNINTAHTFHNPNATSSLWERFRTEFPRELVAEVIPREGTKLPDCFVPLARGVVVASDALLRTAGYRPGSRKPSGWRRIDRDVYKCYMTLDHALLVRGCGDLWTVEHHRFTRKLEAADRILVFEFSTPVFTRTYQAAMRLGEYCYPAPPARLSWITAVPENHEGAFEYARERRADEAAARLVRPSMDARHQIV